MCIRMIGLTSVIITNMISDPNDFRCAFQTCILQSGKLRHIAVIIQKAIQNRE